MKTLTEPEIVLICMALDRVTDFSSFPPEETDVIYGKLYDYFGSVSDVELNLKIKDTLVSFLEELKEDE